MFDNTKPQDGYLALYSTDYDCKVVRLQWVASLDDALEKAEGYGTKELALAVLKDCGFEAVEYFDTFQFVLVDKDNNVIHWVFDPCWRPISPLENVTADDEEVTEVNDKVVGFLREQALRACAFIAFNLSKRLNDGYKASVRFDHKRRGIYTYTISINGNDFSKCYKAQVVAFGYTGYDEDAFALLKAENTYVDLAIRKDYEGLHHDFEVINDFAKCYDELRNIGIAK